VAVLALLLAGAGWLLGAAAADQFDGVTEQVSAGVEQAEAALERHAWGRWTLAHAPSAQQVLTHGRADLVARITGVFSTTLGVLANLLLVVAVGLYGAAAPGLYLDGAVRLVPVRHRDRAREVLQAISVALRRWMLGRLVAAAAVGVFCGVGLALLGVPQAAVLGLLAGVLTVVPYIGPVTAAVPAVLVALLQSPALALYVVLLYTAAQMVENYVLTPVVQRRAVELPPALSLVALVLLGVLFGPLGVVLGAPLTVAALVAVKMLYVEDTLGDPVQVPGDSGAAA
jgi:predicted PurR-regulated permease PerM